MSAGSATHRSIDLIEGAGAALVGGGVITMALFPLALPMVALLAVAAAALLLVVAIPFLALAVAGGIIAAAVAAPAILLRGLWRVSVPALRRMRHHGPAPRARERLTNG